MAGEVTSESTRMATPTADAGIGGRMPCSGSGGHCSHWAAALYLMPTRGWPVTVGMAYLQARVKPHRAA